MDSTKAPQQPEPQVLDSYEAKMEKAEQRRKRIVLALGVLTFGGIFAAMLATFQSLGDMNRDIPGVFEKPLSLAAKAQPELALVHPPKPPTPAEFKQRQASGEYSQADHEASGAETGTSIAVPASSEIR